MAKATQENQLKVNGAVTRMVDYCAKADQKISEHVSTISNLEAQVASLCEKMDEQKTHQQAVINQKLDIISQMEATTVSLNSELSAKSSQVEQL